MTYFVWEDAENLRVNDVKFFVTFNSAQVIEFKAECDNFLLWKSTSMIEQYKSLIVDNHVKKIFELGIFKGGSVALYDQLSDAEKIVAVDFNHEPVDALTNYISSKNKRHSVKPFYGINQADKTIMCKILTEEFPNRDIDLVIDDASHRYEETKASFNFIFPYIKPGGHYVIEDWAWAHWQGRWQEKPHRMHKWWAFWKKKPPLGEAALSNLLIELFMLAASQPRLIESISLNHDLIIVKKGLGQLENIDFDIGNYYLMRGKKFKPFL